jgi:hypothetical protein
MRQRLYVTVVATGLVMFCVLANASNWEGRSGNQNEPSPELIAKLAAAKKPAVGQPLVIGGEEVCGPKGNTSNTQMQDLNNNKNRTDEPGPNDYVPVDWEAMENLPADKVNEIQGTPVAVVGYLSNRVNVENKSPGESTNCNLLNPDEVDWHMYLTEKPRQQIAFAIIVETTPRVRPNHKWTTQMLAPYVNQSKQVRISGWLMYDFQHLNVVGKERATVWEVHPITRIEVQDAQGNWVNIEQ